MSRVPITGIGVIAPGAIGVEAFRALLASGQSAIGDVDRFDTTGLAAHRAALLRDFRPKDFIAPMRMRRMMRLALPVQIPGMMAWTSAAMPAAMASRPNLVAKRKCWR